MQLQACWSVEDEDFGKFRDEFEEAMKHRRQSARVANLTLWSGAYRGFSEEEKQWMRMPRTITVWFRPL